jgi:hypothetical protein
VERSAPREVQLLSSIFPGKIFFLSWRRLLACLEGKRAAMDREHQVYLEDFFARIRAEKLWRLFPMTADELKSFVAHYPEVFRNTEAGENELNRLLQLLCTRAIAASGERAEDHSAEEYSQELPCIYCTLKVHGWHTMSSAYIFINAALTKVGIVLIGYEKRTQKVNFMSRWHESFKTVFAGDLDIRTFVWEDEDEIAGDNGYFKLIEGTTGQVFDPSKFQVFDDVFYWGYWHDLDVSNFDSTSQLDR